MKKLAFTLVLLYSINSFAQTALFSVNVDSGCAPLCADFQDNSANAVAWLWDFGDSSQGSTFTAPAHCYVTPGTYTVTLTVTFANNSTGTATHLMVIYPNPIANYTWTNVGSNTISFTDQSVGATSWWWYFGDQTTSTLQNPVHTYSTPGLDTVFLEVTNSFGCTDTTSGGSIVVVGLDEMQAESVCNIFPNPSDNGLFTVHWINSTQSGQTISVENSIGECVLRQNILSGGILDISNQPAGCYFVRMENGSAQKILIH